MLDYQPLATADAAPEMPIFDAAASCGCGEPGCPASACEPLDATGNGCLEASAGPFEEVASQATTGEAYGIWHLGNRVLVAETTGGLAAYDFDGASFTEVDRFETGYAEAIWNRGPFIYMGSPGYGFFVLAQQDDGSLNQIASETETVAEARRMWGDDQLIYVPSGTAGLYAYDFDGTTLTQVGDSLPADSFAQGVWTDGATIYLADNQWFRALTFDGGAFSEIDSVALASTGRVFGRGDVVFASSDVGVHAFRRNGDALEEIAMAPTASTVREIWSDGVHIFAAAYDTGLYAFRFDGSSFDQVDLIATEGKALGVVGDGSYIYLSELDAGVRAFAGFQCVRHR